MTDSAGTKERRRDGGALPALEPPGTGFPGVFYLKYHYYRHSFPVLALSTYLKTRGGQSEYKNGANRK